MLNTISITSCNYGGSVAIGIKSNSDIKTTGSNEINQFYNFFYNHELTNGSLYEMNEGKFAYFLTDQIDINRISKINSNVTPKILTLIKDIEEEIFIR